MRQLQDYQPVTDFLLSSLVKRYRIECAENLGDIFASHPRLVVVFSHSTPLSWIPAPCLLTKEACRMGGGRRVPLGIIDRFFFSNPILKPLAEYVTQSDRPLSFDELIEHFNTLPLADIVVFPEGSNCFFGDPEEIQDFRSPRFVELAIRTGVPLLLAVHHGSELWAKSIAIPPVAQQMFDYLPSFLRSRVGGASLFTMPWLTRQIEDFNMVCELYHPTLKAEDLASDKEKCRSQVANEAQRVRERMKQMLNKAKIQSPDRLENSSEALSPF